MGRFLWKPRSESTGGLFIGADIPTSSLRIIDLTTGEVLATGTRDTRAGQNNGYLDGFRFNTQGGNFNNVAVVDDQGRQVARIGSGGNRIEAKFDSLDNLYKTPPSTYKGSVPLPEQSYTSPESATTSTIPEVKNPLTSPMGLATTGLTGYAGYRAVQDALGEEATKEVVKDKIVGLDGSEAVMSEQPSLLAQTGSNALGMANSLGGAGALAGIATGTYVSALDAKNLLQGKTDNSTAGKAGRLQNAINTGGLSEVGRAFGFGSRGRDYGQEQRDRISKLRESGAIRDDQFQGYGTWDKNTEDGGKGVSESYSNIKTGGKATDIWGLPAFYEKFGADYEGKMTEAERFKVAQDVMDSGAFIKKDYGFDVDWNKYDKWKAANQGQDTTVLYNAYKNQPTGTQLQQSSIAPQVNQAGGYNKSAPTEGGVAGVNDGIAVNEISGSQLAALEANNAAMDAKEAYRMQVAGNMLGGDSSFANNLINDSFNPQKKQSQFQLAGANLGSILTGKR